MYDTIIIANAYIKLTAVPLSTCCESFKAAKINHSFQCKKIRREVVGSGFN
jgi:hypothetical protein